MYFIFQQYIIFCFCISVQCELKEMQLTVNFCAGTMGVRFSVIQHLASFQEMQSLIARVRKSKRLLWLVNCYLPHCFFKCMVVFSLIMSELLYNIRCLTSCERRRFLIVNLFLLLHSVRLFNVYFINMAICHCGAAYRSSFGQSVNC